MPKTFKRKIPLAKTEGFTFDPVAHAYTLDGKPMIGVTSVLSVINKPMLIQWSANMACDEIEDYVKYDLSERIPAETVCQNLLTHVIKSARTAHRKKKEAAGQAGTDVHAIIEEIIKKSIGDSSWDMSFASSGNEVIDSQVRHFLTWAKDKNVKFLASELRMYSKKLFCAGTADFICEIDGKLYVGDVKTSSGIYPEHFIQASAYAHMAREMGLYQDFHGVIIVNVPKTGGLNVKENYDLKGNFNSFKAALTLHKHLNN